MQYQLLKQQLLTTERSCKLNLYLHFFHFIYEICVRIIDSGFFFSWTYSNIHLINRLISQMFPTVLCKIEQHLEWRAWALVGVWNSAISVPGIFFFSCRNLADHWDLYFFGFDMKLLKGLSGLCLSISALKWAWLFSFCSQWPHFSALESADGQLTLQTGHMPSQEQIPLQWCVGLVLKSKTISIRCSKMDKGTPYLWLCANSGNSSQYQQLVLSKL